MPARGQWMFNPDSGGKKIPETVKRNIEQRIHAVANEQFSGKYKRLDIRFRGHFVILTPILNRGSRKTGRRQTGRKPEKNIWIGCATPLSIYAVCVTSVTTGGVLYSTPTTTRSTIFLYSRMVSLSELRKKRYSHLR
jgi:hypothetical protein